MIYFKSVTMIFHYLKVAIRNLLAHKTQTFVSLFGLAIAFACVSLATYWNHYERTYDSFQENADRIFRIRYFDTARGGVQDGTPYPLHLYLKENYPEAKLILQVHDELIVECPEEIAEKVCFLVSEQMQQVVQLKLPLLFSWFHPK